MKKLMVLCMGLSGCVSTLPAPADDQQNRVVDIVNTSNNAVRFYAINAEQRGLNRQRSHEAEVAANYYRTLNFDDETGACLFDFHAEFAGGQSTEAKRFNTCRNTSWVVE